MEALDAVAWLKTPGETDGCSQIGEGCPGPIDSMCKPDDSHGPQFGGSDAGNVPVPSAGTFFNESACVLAGNAKFDAALVYELPYLYLCNNGTPTALACDQVHR